MDSYKKYQTAKQATKESADWMSNKDKIDSQDRKPYGLCNLSFSAEYCGQSYAGATNYHKSPSTFNSAMTLVIQERFAELSEAALSKIKAAESNALISCEGDIAVLQREIWDAKEASA
ncbi:hypothetical protein [Pseudomonas fluorescens]|uniref:hypothetical protein n=1 Tax=Pseudomonas fluorescens TaxID=294 RepID=UPI0005FB00AC|nr:hypothetical protein [Pseudomonas fluorescens]KJZ41343.1 hypothetical protein VC33_00410 [Pseudomonas fluorescens]